MVNQLTLVRFSFPVLCAAGITLSLFYLMQFLIASTDALPEEVEVFSWVDIVRIKIQPEVITQDKSPTPPPEPEPMPDPGKVSRPGQGTVTIYEKPVLEPAPSTGLDFGLSDGRQLPIIKVKPVYPRRALSGGLTGWVVVEFTVTKQGTVAAPRVVDHCATNVSSTAESCEASPNPVFDQSAINAVLKFRYKPRIVDGVPRESHGVRNKIRFQLANN